MLKYLEMSIKIKYLIYEYMNGVHSASWVQLTSYLKEIVADPVQKFENTAVGDQPRWLLDTPLSEKVGTNFAAVARPVYFARGLRPRSLFVLIYMNSKSHLIFAQNFTETVDTIS
jgi:hypothetical protein